MAEEIVDVLLPPRFEPSGKTKLRTLAAKDGDWTGAFNIWLYSTGAEPSILYQQRSLKKTWEPGKLDVSVGGHYSVGEFGLDGLREVKEEIGIDLPVDKIDYWGKKVNVSLNVHGHECRNAISVYTSPLNCNLEELNLQESEVTAVFWVPVKKLLEVFEKKRRAFFACGIDNQNNPLEYTVTADSFPFNFDNYHYRMAEHIAIKTKIL